MQRLMPTHTDAPRNPLGRGLVALMLCSCSAVFLLAPNIYFVARRVTSTEEIRESFALTKGRSGEMSTGSIGLPKR